MEMVDWRRFGLERAELSRDALEAKLGEAAAAVLDKLDGEGRRQPGATSPPLALPPDFGALLERTLTFEATEQADGWEVRVMTLLAYYLEIMPGLRVAQVCTADEPQATLFHAPLDWERLPRLGGAIRRFFALVTGAGVPAERALGAPDADAFLARHGTLASVYAGTYFSGVMPILYGFPADMAAYGAELGGGEDRHAVIDRWLAAPVVHELSHLSRRRRPLEPPYLDECVAGFLGVCALPALELPAPGERGGLFMAPWFAQVGRAIAAVVGLAPMIRAHAGVEPWAAVLPAGLGPTWAALGWDGYLASRGVHFLGDNFHPEPWLKALYLAAAGALPARPDRATLEAFPWSAIPCAAPTERDVEGLAAALHAACLEPELVASTWRVGCGPARAPVIVDLERCVVRVAGPKHPLEPVPLAVLCPPPLAAALRAAGHRRLRVAPLAPDAVEEAARAIAAGIIPASGPGWAVDVALHDDERGFSSYP
ncbi:MAG: hypothetical protein CVU56_28385 [Deltaproteobacteria bacterium HGW-Deltaproteobacteria-14]|jgi:hypothetical protein|nr:MAG: hypothetical protein CVU56_28385 [Deltaproteobacteria bacterium HGW-Deltaproteobacteria-14]